MDRNTTERSAFAKGLLLAIPTILIWGVTFVNTKALLDDFSAFEILFLRFIMAYAALWCLKPKRLAVSGWREELPSCSRRSLSATVLPWDTLV